MGGGAGYRIGRIDCCIECGRIEEDGDDEFNVISVPDKPWSLEVYIVLIF